MPTDVKLEVRTLQKLGGSLALYLPKEWCDRNGLAKGSRVVVKYGGRFLCLETEKGTRREALVDLDEVLEIDLKYILISLYVLGFDRVRLSSRKKISLTLRKYILTLLNYTPGYEIVEEGENFLDVGVAREVKNPAEALLREFNGVFALFKYAAEALEKAPNIPDDYVEAIEELDNEVDRAWFEVERAVYKAVEGPGLTPTRSKPLVSLLLVSRYLERLSDHLVQLVREVRALPAQQHVAAAQIRSLLLGYYDVAKFFESIVRERERARDLNVVTKLVEVIEGKRLQRHGVIAKLRREGGDLVAYHVMRIYDYITDVAEVLVNVILNDIYSEESGGWAG